MRIASIINNNIISSFDEEGKEVIVMGRGIGFGRKSGGEIPEEKIEKVFRIRSQDISEQFKELLADMNFEHVKISNDIIAFAKEKYHLKLSQSIYVTLTDHINFAIERFREGIEPENALLWEIRSFYNSEYQVGKFALNLIRERLELQMGEGEAGFIALHFINAEYETKLGTAIEIPHMIKEILQIVKEELGIELDEKSLHYERFLTHLKFLLQRVYKHELLTEDEDELSAMVRRKYAREYHCSERIVSYIQQKTGIQISGEETMYLSIHIRRIQSRADEEDCDD